MLRSMYAGVSGMRSYQTKMDVIGNNIANVGTPAFKSGRVQFQDLLSETISSGQGPLDTGLGGTNPQQVGLGVSVGRIDTIMRAGALQPTGRDLDLALEGDGFFVVSDQAIVRGTGIDLANNSIRYTRDGSFVRDSEGNLTMGNGYRVVGKSFLINSGASAGNIDVNYAVPVASGSAQETEITTPMNSTGVVAVRQGLKIPNTYNDGTDDIRLDDFSIDGDGLVKARYADGETFYVGRIEVVRFTNPDGMMKMGGNTYTTSSNSGDPTSGIGGQAGFGIIRSGFSEMSNVDLANEFTDMIITSRSYQANSRSITTSDEMLQELLNLKR